MSHCSFSGIFDSEVKLSLSIDNPELSSELGQNQHSMYPHVLEGTTDFLTRFSVSSSLCIRMQCWRKLSSRGQILSFFGQFAATQRKLLSEVFLGAIL